MQLPDEYCGSRARAANPSDDDERKEGQRLPNKFERLKSHPEANYIDALDHLVSSLPRKQALVINLRRAGLKHREVAEELRMSTAAAWRLEQAAHERMRTLWNS
jgi:DNA-directed RNA polymerase specialized sigma24 family protein